MAHIEGRELERVRMIVNEMFDFLGSISNEVNQDRAYKAYLAEKIRGLETDLICLKSMVE